MKPLPGSVLLTKWKKANGTGMMVPTWPKLLTLNGPLVSPTTTEKARIAVQSCTMDTPGMTCRAKLTVSPFANIILIQLANHQKMKAISGNSTEVPALNSTGTILTVNLY